MEETSAICSTGDARNTSENVFSSVSSNTKSKLDKIPKIRGFKMASLNIVSIPKHFDELAVFMEDKQPDLISLNETMDRNRT